MKKYVFIKEIEFLTINIRDTGFGPWRSQPFSPYSAGLATRFYIQFQILPADHNMVLCWHKIDLESKLKRKKIKRFSAIAYR